MTILTASPDAYVQNMTWEMAQDEAWIDAHSRSLFKCRMQNPHDLRSSLQLSVGVLNLGHLHRPSVLPDGYILKQNQAHLRMALENYCHILLFAEAGDYHIHSDVAAMFTANDAAQIAQVN